MSRGKEQVAQQAPADRRWRKRRRLLVWISAAVGLAAIVATVALTGPPAYSGFDVIGKQPAIVQVYLPG